MKTPQLTSWILIFLIIACIGSACTNTKMNEPYKEPKILKRGGDGLLKIEHVKGGILMSNLIDEFQSEMEDESKFHYAGKYRGIRQLASDISGIAHCDGAPGDPRLDKLNEPEKIKHEFRISEELLLEPRHVLP